MLVFGALANAGCSPLILALIGGGAGSGSRGGTAQQAHVQLDVNPAQFVRASLPDANNVPIAYALTSSAPTSFNVQVQYAMASGASGASSTFFVADEAPGGEGTTGLAPGQHTFVWQATNDLHGEADVLILVRAVGTDGAETFTILGPFRLGDVPPTAAIDPARPPVVAGANGAPGGNVVVRFQIVDPASDPCDIAVRYVLPGGQPQPATVASGATRGLVTSPAGEPHDFVWDSVADLGRVREPGVVLEIVATDRFSASSPPLRIGPFTVDNNTPPSIQVVEPGTVAKKTGEIPVRFALFDRESNPVSVVVQYALGQDAFPALPAEIADPAIRAGILADPARRRELQIATRATFLRDAVVSAATATTIRSHDFRDPTKSPQLALKRVTLLDGANAGTVRTIAAYDPALATITLDAPLVAVPRPGDRIAISAGDYESAPGGVAGVFSWDAGADVAPGSAVRLRLTPFDSEMGAPAETLAFTPSPGPLGTAFDLDQGPNPSTATDYSLVYVDPAAATINLGLSFFQTNSTFAPNPLGSGFVFNGSLSGSSVPVAAHGSPGVAPAFDHPAQFNQRAPTVVVGSTPGSTVSGVNDCCPAGGGIPPYSQFTVFGPPLQDADVVQLEAPPAIGFEPVRNMVLWATRELDSFAGSFEGGGVALITLNSLEVNGVNNGVSVKPISTLAPRPAPEAVAFGSVYPTALPKGGDIVILHEPRGPTATVTILRDMGDPNQDLFDDYAETAAVSVPAGPGQRTLSDGTVAPLGSKVFAADLTGDGLGAVIVLCRGALTVLTHAPSGDIVPLEIAELAGALVADVAVADLNGDGRNDLLYLDCAGAGALVVHLQLPGGSLGRPVRLPTPSGDPGSLGALDFFLTGSADVAIRTARLAQVALVDYFPGSPALAPEAAFASAAPAAIYPVTLGDGRFAVDVITAPGTASAGTTFVAAANGALGPAASLLPLTDVLAEGDLDGDALPDAIVRDPSVAGANAGLVRLREPSGALGLALTPLAPPAGILPQGWLIGDVDDDGRADVLMWGSSDAPGVATPFAVYIYAGLPGGTLAPVAGPLLTDVGWPLDWALADLDRDGRLDLVAVLFRGEQDANGVDEVDVVTWRGLPGGGFGPETLLFQAPRDAQPKIAVLDPSGSGFPEIQLGRAPAQNGDTARIFGLDVDGDGLPDRVDQGPADPVTGIAPLAIRLRRPDGTYAPPLAAQVGAAPLAPLAAIDATGEGRPDLLAGALPLDVAGRRGALRIDGVATDLAAGTAVTARWLGVAAPAGPIATGLVSAAGTFRLTLFDAQEGDLVEVAGGGRAAVIEIGSADLSAGEIADLVLSSLSTVAASVAEQAADGRDDNAAVGSLLAGAPLDAARGGLARAGELVPGDAATLRALVLDALARAADAQSASLDQYVAALAGDIADDGSLDQSAGAAGLDTRRTTLGTALAAALAASGLAPGAFGGSLAALADPSQNALAARPTIASVSPPAGPVSGGTRITISGGAFEAGTRAYVGGVEAAGVSVLSPTELTATTPPGAAGTAAVAVMTPRGLSAGAPDAFVYLPSGGHLVVAAVLDLGRTVAGPTAASAGILRGSLVLANDAAASGPLAVTLVAPAPGPFALAGTVPAPGAPLAIPPGGSAAVGVVFSAGAAAGVFEAAVAILSDDPLSPTTEVTVKAQAVAPDAFVALGVGPVEVAAAVGTDVAVPVAVQNLSFPVELENGASGGVTLTVAAPAVPGGAPFAVEGFPLAIAPGATQTFTLHYRPTQAATPDAVALALTATGADPRGGSANAAAVLQVTGRPTGGGALAIEPGPAGYAGPVLAAAPAPVTSPFYFGAVDPTGTAIPLRFVLRNHALATVPLTVESVSLDGPDAAAFSVSIAGGASLPALLAPDQGLAVDVGFAPAAPGAAHANLRILCDDARFPGPDGLALPLVAGGLDPAEPLRRGGGGIGGVPITQSNAVRVSVFDQRTGAGIVGAPVAIYVAPQFSSGVPATQAFAVAATGADGSVTVPLTPDIVRVDVHAGVVGSGLQSFLAVPSSEVAMGFALYPVDPTLGAPSPSTALSADISTAQGDPVIIESGYDFARDMGMPFQQDAALLSGNVDLTGPDGLRVATLPLEAGFGRYALGAFRYLGSPGLVPSATTPLTDAVITPLLPLATMPLVEPLRFDQGAGSFVVVQGTLAIQNWAALTNSGNALLGSDGSEPQIVVRAVVEAKDGSIVPIGVGLAWPDAWFPGVGDPAIAPVIPFSVSVADPPFASAGIPVEDAADLRIEAAIHTGLGTSTSVAHFTPATFAGFPDTVSLSTSSAFGQSDAQPPSGLSQGPPFRAGPYGPVTGLPIQQPFDDLFSAFEGFNFSPYPNQGVLQFSLFPTAFSVDGIGPVSPTAALPWLITCPLGDVSQRQGNLSLPDLPDLLASLISFGPMRVHFEGSAVPANFDYGSFRLMDVPRSRAARVVTPDYVIDLGNVPVIDGFTPTGADVSAGPITVTITGRRFQPGATVGMFGTGTQASAPTIVGTVLSESPTEIVATFDPAPLILAGGGPQPLGVVVENPDQGIGVSSGPINPLIFTWQRFSIASMTPQSANAADGPVTLTITGAGLELVPGAPLQLLTLDNGPNGNDLENGTIVSATSTEIVVTFDVPPNLGPGSTQANLLFPIPNVYQQFGPTTDASATLTWIK
jgi:hypothetical protein